MSQAMIQTIFRSSINAGQDLWTGLKKSPLAILLGWQDIKQRYRRSIIGPFWLTITMAVLIATLGIVFGQIFRSDLGEFLPFLAIGLIIWTFISSVVNDSCASFTSSQGMILQLKLPFSLHVMRMIWRNMVILFHNILIYPVILLYYGNTLPYTFLLSVIGFFVLLCNLSWISLFIGILCTRFRDLPQVIGSIIQVLFYFTPIIWMPNLLPERSGLLILALNPLYHLIEIIRVPLLGGIPSTTNWLVSIGLALFGWLITIPFYGRYKDRIPYWL